MERFKGFSKPGIRQDSVCLLCIMAFVVVALPTARLAIESPHEMITFNWDEFFGMFRPFSTLVHGHYPPFEGYGRFPLFCAGFFSVPFIAAKKLFGSEFSFFQLSLLFRVVQIFVAAVGLWFVYRVASVFCRPVTALAAVLLFLTCPCFYEWTWTMHPDIFQFATLAGATYFLLLYHRFKRRKDLLLCATLAGFAAGSKYWGIFIVPAAIVCIGINAALDPKRKFREGGLYVFTLAASFLIFNIEFLTSPRSLYGKMIDYSRATGAVHASLVNRLQGIKLTLLSSPEFFGSAFFLLYVAVFLWDALALLSRKTPLKGRHLLHLVLLPLWGYFFLLFNDWVNLPEGERYLLSFFPLMMVAVLSALEQLVLSRRWRLLGLSLIGLLCLSQGLRIAGVSHRKFDLGQSDLFGLKPEASLQARLGYFQQKEEQGTFLIRQWIAENLPPGASVFFEAYMNLRDVPDENRDLPSLQLHYEYRTDEKKVALFKPDYVLTTGAEIAHRIEGDGYRLLSTVGMGRPNEVFVLSRRK